MSLLRTLLGTVTNPIAIHASRFTLHAYDSRYGGEQEKRPCGQFSAAHLLVQDREKGETIPLTKVIYSKAQWALDSNDWRLAIAS